MRSIDTPDRIFQLARELVLVLPAPVERLSSVLRLSRPIRSPLAARRLMPGTPPGALISKLELRIPQRDGLVSFVVMEIASSRSVPMTLVREAFGEPRSHRQPALRGLDWGSVYDLFYVANCEIRASYAPGSGILNSLVVCERRGRPVGRAPIPTGRDTPVSAHIESD